MKKSSLLFLVITVVSCLVFGQVVTPALAFSKDTVVTAVDFSSDFDTATITLSRNPGEKVHIAYDLYVGDSTSAFAGGGTNQQGPTVTLSGFKDDFTSAGKDGTRFRLQFRVCPYDEPYTGMHQYQYCSQQFVTYVTYVESAASNVVVPSITNATVSSDYETISVELSSSIAKGYIRYKRWGSGNGLDYSSQQYRVDNKQVVVLTGIRQGFEQSGTSGKQSITLQPCVEQSSGAGDATCGSEYSLTINIPVSASFRDVPDSHANAEAIRYVQQEGIVAGYSDGTFKPDRMINRAEFTKIVTLALFGQEMIDKCGTVYPFSDVPPGAWYVKHICRARDGWLLTGYPDGTFHPAQNINFSEAAKILANGYALIERSEHCNGKLCPDVDTAEHPWYEQYVRALDEQNAIPLSIRRFEQSITRGEMAEMIHRLKAEITSKSSKQYEQF